MDYLPKPKPSRQAALLPTRPAAATGTRVASRETRNGSVANTCITPRPWVHPWLLFLPTLVVCVIALAACSAGLLGLKPAMSVLAVALFAHNTGALVARLIGGDSTGTLFLIRVALPLAGACAIALVAIGCNDGQLTANWLHLVPYLENVGIKVGICWVGLYLACSAVAKAMKGTLWLMALRVIGCFVLATLYGAVMAQRLVPGIVSLEMLLLLTGVVTAAMVWCSDETAALPIQILTLCYLVFYRDSGGDLQQIGHGFSLVLTLALTLCAPVLAGWFVFGRKRVARR